MSPIDVLSKDPVMRRLVDTYGVVKISRNPIFMTMVRSVIYLQSSEESASDTLNRLQNIAEITPDALSQLDIESFKSCGISKQKAGYIKAISKAATNGELERINKMPYDDVLKYLLKIRGVVYWTAQMVLIFGLGRDDVWPHDDVRLQKAARNLYGVKTVDDFNALGDKFRPYRSHAAWYLWRSLAS